MITTAEQMEGLLARARECGLLLSKGSSEPTTENVRRLRDLLELENRRAQIAREAAAAIAARAAAKVRRIERGPRPDPAKRAAARQQIKELERRPRLVKRPLLRVPAMFDSERNGLRPQVLTDLEKSALREGPLMVRTRIATILAQARERPTPRAILQSQIEQALRTRRTSPLVPVRQADQWRTIENAIQSVMGCTSVQLLTLISRLKVVVREKARAEAEAVAVGQRVGIRCKRRGVVYGLVVAKRRGRILVRLDQPDGPDDVVAARPYQIVLEGRTRGGLKVRRAS
jgi:hypothetical protein